MHEATVGETGFRRLILWVVVLFWGLGCTGWLFFRKASRISRAYGGYHAVIAVSARLHPLLHADCCGWSIAGVCLPSGLLSYCNVCDGYEPLSKDGTQVCMFDFLEERSGQRARYVDYLLHTSASLDVEVIQ